MSSILSKEDLQKILAIQPESEYQKNTINRYSNVRSYAYNSVKLKNGTVLNASRIKYDNKEWIVTQGPLDQTIQDFWKMVEENDIESIIMLTDFYEDYQEKCAEYLPKTGEPIKLDGINIIFDKEEDKNNIRITAIKLTYPGTNKMKKIKHIQYRGWPDMGSPNIEIFHNNMKIIDYEVIGKTIVHCSAGIGRSGMYLFIKIVDMMKEEMNLETVKNIIEILRSQRVGMVQTWKQLDFCIKYCNQYLTLAK